MFVYYFRNNTGCLCYSSNEITVVIRLPYAGCGNGPYLRGTVCPRDVPCYARAMVRGSFTLRATGVASGATLVVDTPEPLSNVDGDDLRFDRGSLTVTADDGSRISLAADNGEPTSFAVTVFAEGAENTWNRAWDEVRGRLEFVR